MNDRINVRSLIRAYLKEHGPSKAPAIYNGIHPYIDGQVGFSGVANTLNRTPDFKTPERGIFALEGQITDSLMLYPPYARTILEHVCNGRVTEHEAMSLLNERKTQVHGKLTYLVELGLLERSPGRNASYKPSEKARKIMQEKHTNK